jgi:hypothetical protein
MSRQRSRVESRTPAGFFKGLQIRSLLRIQFTILTKCDIIALARFVKTKMLENHLYLNHLFMAGSSCRYTKPSILPKTSAMVGIFIGREF